MHPRVIIEFQDSSVGAELLMLLGDGGYSTAVLRAWDSLRDPQQIKEVLDGFGIPSVTHRAGAVLELAHVDLASLVPHLHGFDEIWFGTDATEWSPIAEAPAMTSDSIRFDEDTCEPFKAALVQSRALIGLADGCGLNIVRRLVSGSSVLSPGCVR